MYDIIIAGGGCAGLSLAYHLHQYSEFEGKILILDQDTKTNNDRTWCFWTEQPTLFDELVTHQWTRLAFVEEDFEQIFEIAPLVYKRIEAKDFYAFIKNALQKDDRFHFVQNRILSITPNDNNVLVKTQSVDYQAKIVFDSLVDYDWLKRVSQPYKLILQHFLGWRIKTQTPVFQTDIITQFDLRLSQENQVRFVYILPFSPYEALVEFTVFSQGLLKEEDYIEVLKNYLKNNLEITDYQIIESEKGVIPMTDYPFRLKSDNRVFHLGIKAGMCKSSTGYTFLNIQRDSAKLAQAIVQNQISSVSRSLASRYRLYDAMLLDIMFRRAGSIKKIFSILYQKNGAKNVLRFLDERMHFVEELRIMASVPPLPFVLALKNIFLRKCVFFIKSLKR